MGYTDFFKDFKTLDIPIKVFIMGVLLNSPIWFFDIFLFDKPFFSNPLYIVIIASYCLTLASLIGNLYVSLAIHIEKRVIVGDLLISTIISPAHLLIMTAICYKYSLSFITLVKWTFLTTFFGAVILRVSTMITKRLKEKTEKLK